jgi:hypothetical protein
MDIGVEKHSSQTKPWATYVKTLTQVSGYSLVKEQSSSCTSAQFQILPWDEASDGRRD